MHQATVYQPGDMRNEHLKLMPNQRESANSILFRAILAINPSIIEWSGDVENPRAKRRHSRPCGPLWRYRQWRDFKRNERACLTLM